MQPKTKWNELRAIDIDILPTSFRESNWFTFIYKTPKRAIILKQFFCALRKSIQTYIKIWNNGQENDEKALTKFQKIFNFW